MKKSNRLTVLPNKLVGDLENLSLTAIQYNKAIQLLDILKQKSLNKYEAGFIFGESSLSQAYLKTVFNSKYTDFLNPLIASGVIVRDDSYNVTAKVAKKYSINNRYENDLELNSSLADLLKEITEGSETAVLKNKESRMLNYTVKSSAKEDREDNYYLANFKKDFKTLDINVEKLTKITADRLSRLTIKDFAINEEVAASAVRVKRNGKWVYLKTSKAIEVARAENKSLIQDKGNYYIENEVRFLVRKVNNIYNSYSEVISKLGKKYYYANRNTTNRRLDTNITSMCKEFMDVIIEDNNLVELDMCNSQFAILSHILPDLGTEDFKLFKKLSFSGELYEYIQSELKLEGRKEAKNITFQVLFGSEKQSTVGLKQFSSLFPSVLEWINGYKKENGYKNFPIMLQAEEANIFVDDIYTELKSKKLFCITKHDSIIVRKGDLEEVKTFTREYFDSIGFEGTLK